MNKKMTMMSDGFFGSVITRIFCTTLIALFGGLLAAGTQGCDKSSASGTALRVALILPGSENDKGWNQMAKQGLDMIKSNLSAETRYSSNVQPAEFASRIAYYADEGYDVIICHGGEFRDAVTAAVKKYPKVHFIVGGCADDIPGANAVEFMPHDASVLVGVVAAKVSKAKTVAFVGAQAVPPLQACYDGMKEGLALAGSGEVKILPAQWTDSWDSATKAKEKTEAVLAAGADVVFQNVDAAASGVFEAVQAANKPGKPAYAFGCNGNQNDLAPDVILGSVVLDVPRAYLDLTKQIQAKTLAPKALKLGLKEGYVDLVLNEKHPAVTAEVKAAVAAAQK